MEAYFFKITTLMIGIEYKSQLQFIANFNSLFHGIEYLLSHLIFQFSHLNRKENQNELLYTVQTKKNICS